MFIVCSIFTIESLRCIIFVHYEAFFFVTDRLFYGILIKKEGSL